METTRSYRIGCAGLLLALSACAELDGIEPDGLDAIEFRGGGRSTPPVGDGSRGGGGDWIGNGLIDPQISGVDVAYSLNSSNGLSDEDGWLVNDDDVGVDAIRHMIECALDDGQTVKKNYKGDKITFYGRLGLAPEWRTAACDEDCQQWVSACMLARTNPAGETANIWVEGDHPALGLGTHPDYPLYEASFYGNLFTTTQVKNSCQGDEEGIAAAQGLSRTCSSGDLQCGFVSDGDCVLDADCDLGESGEPLACRTAPAGPSYHTIIVHVGAPLAQ